MMTSRSGRFIDAPSGMEVELPIAAAVSSVTDERDMMRRNTVLKIKWAIWSLVLALVTTGCSTFNREWKEATTHPPVANEISGRWEGSWRSEKNRHTGELRCMITKAGNNRFRAHYKATYWKCLRFSYITTLRVEKVSEDVHRFDGTADLGWWGGGIYRCQGYATPTNFTAIYKSRHDHGIFQMKRPN